MRLLCFLVVSLHHHHSSSTPTYTFHRHQTSRVHGVPTSTLLAIHRFVEATSTETTENATNLCSPTSSDAPSKHHYVHRSFAASSTKTATAIHSRRAATAAGVSAAAAKATSFSQTHPACHDPTCCWIHDNVCIVSAPSHHANYSQKHHL